MTDREWLTVLVVSVAALLPSLAPAAEAARHQCATVADDSARLACYDSVFGRPADSARTSAPAAVAPPQAAVAPPQAAVAPPQAAVAPPQAAVTPPQAAANAVPAGDPANFGLSRWDERKLDPKAAERQSPSSFVAKVTTVEWRRDNRFVVTLDNSQVWQQAETLTTARPMAGDPVTIRAAALGSYLLVTKASIATRVRRVR
jgi:hypothetical protein